MNILLSATQLFHSKTLYLLVLILSLQSTSFAMTESSQLIDQLILKAKRSCPSSSNEVIAEATLPDEREILEALLVRHCQSGKREVPNMRPGHWTYAYFLELNAEIAKETKQYQQYVDFKLKTIEFKKTQKAKEGSIISLRDEFKKEKYPKIFKKIHDTLLEVSPRYIGKPKKTEYIKVGRDYRKNGNFKKAYKYLRLGWQKLKLSPKENAELSLELTKVIKALYGYREFIPHTEKYLKFFKKQKGTPEYQQAIFDHSIKLIRANWTKGRLSKAKKLATSLRKQFPNKESSYQEWLLALINKDLKKTSLHRRGLLKTLDYLKEEKTTYFELIIFDIANYCYQNRDLSLYKEILKQDLRRIRFERDRQRILYWQARLYQELKKPEMAKKLFSQVIHMNPIGYYALLSSSKTGILPKIEFEEISTKEIPDKLWFLKLKSKKLRENYLAQITFEKTNIEESLLIAKIMQEDGLYHESFKFLYEFDQDDLILALKKYPKLFYPYAFKKLLENRPVDPFLALAIIKRESLYNPNAQSVANALGLMQVLPAVGKQMNRKIKRNKELLDPKTNIDVGTKYIARVLKRFNKNLVLSVAAYNAGPRRVKIWRKKNVFKEDLDESIEKIPYMETRKYVKKVVRNYLNYKRLYDSSFGLDDLKVLIKN